MYLENTKIIEIDSNLSIEEKRKNLKNVYKVMNEIGKELFDKGVDLSNYFFSKSQYEELQKKGKNLI